MAYKFQFGTTKLSGSTTFEESLIGESTISGSGRISGKELILDAAGVIGTSADTDLITLTTDKVSVAGDLSASIDLQGASVVIKQNGRIGVAGDIDLMTLAPNSVSVAGALSASGQVDLPGAVRFGTENQLTVSGVGLLSGSATATLANATLDRITVGDADINGGAIDGVTIGANAAGAGTFTNISGSGTLHAGGVVTFGERALTVSAAGVLSSSATATLANATLDQITVGSADINGGAVDGATIGAAVQSSGKFTTISGSSTLHVAGVSNFGTEAQTTVSAVGLLSSSATATLANATLDRITAPVLLGDMSGSGGLDLMGSVSFGNARLVVQDTQVLITGPVHVSGAAFVEESITTANVAENKSRLAFFDIDSGEMKTTDFKVYADVLAGTGITATAGVLSVDTTGGDSMSATHIPLADYGNFTLATGINFMVNAATGSCSFLLPSGSAGDVVIVKTAADVSSTNFVKISSSVATGDEIDGFSEARIESPFGAVSLIYSNSDAKWVIYQADIVLYNFFSGCPSLWGASFFSYYLIRGRKKNGL